MNVLLKYRLRPTGKKHGVLLLDLDNTLHDASKTLMPKINHLMTTYLAQHLGLTELDASLMRHQYWQCYGATLLGMMHKHNTCPHHFLQQTHALGSLKGQSTRHGSVLKALAKSTALHVLLTNAPLAYATEICQHLGLWRHVHVVIAIETMVVHGRWRPKPSLWLWRALRRPLQQKLQHAQHELRSSPTKLHLLDDTRGHLKNAARLGVQGTWLTLPSIQYKPFPLGGAQGGVRHRAKTIMNACRQRSWGRGSC